MKKYLLPASLGLNLFFLGCLLVIVQVLGGFNYFLFKLTHRGASGWRDHKAQMFALLPDTEGEILFVGNSITEGCEWAELFQNPRIKNRGIGGENSSQIYDRMDEIVSGKPAKVFLMMGTNDLVTETTAQPTLRNIEKTLQKIQVESPQTEIYLQSLLPVNDHLKKTYRDNGLILRINEGMRDLARQYGIIYLDLHSRFTNAGGELDGAYSVDGVHINGQGYLRWKAAIDPYVQPAIPDEDHHP